MMIKLLIGFAPKNPQEKYVKNNLNFLIDFQVLVDFRFFENLGSKMI